MLKFLFAAFSLHVLLSSVESSTLDLFRRESVKDEGEYLEICRQAPMEIGIVLDSSSSIRHKDFQKGISFLKEYLQNFEIGTGAEGVRVSIITYGKGIYPEDGFNLTTYTTKQDVLDAITKIPHKAGLYTDTGKAIKHMHEVQLAPDVVRPYAQKISVVITDGNSQDWRLTKKMAESALADDIIMFAVGVGSGVRDEELNNIAGDPARVTKVENYEQLSSIKQTLASKTCIKKQKPTTTQQPETEPCGEVPTDLYFVFSPSNLGHDATAWTTSFISNTISEDALDANMRFGVVSGSCPDDEGFDLDTYSTVDGYLDRLDAYDRNHLPQLVERLLDGGYNEDKGGRDEARRVAVLVASGVGNEAEGLREYVAHLTARGIQVFIADSTGNELSVDKAVSLSGRSAKEQSEELISFLCPKLGNPGFVPV